MAPTCPSQSHLRPALKNRAIKPTRPPRDLQSTPPPLRLILTCPQGGVHAEQEPQLLGTTENELGIRKWIEEQGHTLVTTSDKEGPNSKFEKELEDAEVIITTPYGPLSIVLTFVY